MLIALCWDISAKRNLDCKTANNDTDTSQDEARELLCQSRLHSFQRTQSNIPPRLKKTLMNVATHLAMLSTP